MARVSDEQAARFAREVLAVAHREPWARVIPPTRSPAGDDELAALGHELLEVIARVETSGAPTRPDHGDPDSPA